MRRAILAVVLLSLLATGCSQYTMRVRVFDRKGRPVMESVSIAVEGKYICGYREEGDRKEPVLKKFFIMDEFTQGDLLFHVWGLPDAFRVSFGAPGFHKLVGSVKREVQPDGHVSYRVMDVNAPYGSSDLRVSKQGYNIYVNGLLEQMMRGRYSPGY